MLAKAGEPTISYWHWIEEGFAGRRLFTDVEKTAR